MMEANSKAKQKKPRQPLYDDKEVRLSLLEMVRGRRAYSKICHNKHLSTGHMLQLQRTLVNKLSLMGQALKNHGDSALNCGSGLKMDF